MAAPRRLPADASIRSLDVLAVNAGSMSLKLALVRGEEAESVDDFVEVDAVGHRIVHGGERLAAPVVIDAEVEREIDALSELAPLHNRAALAALARARKALPDVPHVAVFDTSFFADLPEAACVYPLPYAWYAEWRAPLRFPRHQSCLLRGTCR